MLNMVFKMAQALTFCIPFEDMEEDIKKAIKNKRNVILHKNLAQIFLIFLDKTELIKKAAEAKKLAKIARPLLDSSDQVVRDKISQVFARLKDKYNK